MTKTQNFAVSFNQEDHFVSKKSKDLLKCTTAAAFRTGIVSSILFSYQRTRNGNDFQPHIRSPRPTDNQEVTGTVMNY